MRQKRCSSSTHRKGSFESHVYLASDVLGASREGRTKPTEQKKVVTRPSLRLHLLLPCACVSGIQVRHDQESGYMHHKFAIVDRRMLITGSLNWTTQAIHNNRENLLVVEDAEYVKPFLDEFEKIWEEYNPVNYRFFPKDSK
ncbi:mitochondrial cardiolipin hydrolase [Egretta garzetta]|uniref:mitochondrial cardiolipin hydrolase n=1 Tax=Egretta garzetta TaxID=188379 RepID=UPI00163C138B|nr:mitochondrial cardiolipin hydrolase [Egretta garzetta]